MASTAELSWLLMYTHALLIIVDSTSFSEKQEAGRVCTVAQSLSMTRTDRRPTAPGLWGQPKSLERRSCTKPGAGGESSGVPWVALYFRNKVPGASLLGGV